MYTLSGLFDLATSVLVPKKAFGQALRGNTRDAPTKGSSEQSTAEFDRSCRLLFESAGPQRSALVTSGACHPQLLGRK
jgi:hypothetical protein